MGILVFFMWHSLLDNTSQRVEIETFYYIGAAWFSYHHVYYISSRHISNIGAKYKITKKMVRRTYRQLRTSHVRRSVWEGALVLTNACMLCTPISYRSSCGEETWSCWSSLLRFVVCFLTLRYASSCRKRQSNGNYAVCKKHHHAFDTEFQVGRSVPLCWNLQWLATCPVFWALDGGQRGGQQPNLYWAFRNLPGERDFNCTAYGRCSSWAGLISLTLFETNK